MPKTQEAQSITPLAFIAGKDILAENCRSVARMANWTRGNRPVSYYSGAVGPADAMGSGSVATCGAAFRDAATGFVEVLRFSLYICPDVQAIRVAATCQMETGNTGDVRFTIGGDTKTLSFDDGDNGNELSDLMLPGDTGTGWQVCVVELDQTTPVGSGDNWVVNLRVEEEPISLLSSPPDE